MSAVCEYVLYIKKKVGHANHVTPHSGKTTVTKDISLCLHYFQRITKQKGHLDSYIKQNMEGKVCI